MNNQIMVAGENSILAPKSLQDIEILVGALHRAQMLPKGMENPAVATGAIITGMAVGLIPMQSLQSVAMINGRPTIWGDVVLGLIRRSGLMEEFKESISGEGMTTVATCSVRRKGDVHPVIATFSMQEAKIAGLLGKSGPWSTYPMRMLKLRARKFALRDAFPDVLMGMAIADASDHEELQYEEPQQAESRQDRIERVVSGEVITDPEPEEKAKPKRGKPPTRDELIASFERGMALNNWGDKDHVSKLEALAKKIGPEYVEKVGQAVERYLAEVAQIAHENEDQSLDEDVF